MSNIVKTLGLGNIVNVLSIIFACGLAWGKMNSTVDEMRLLRTSDLARIEKFEGHTDVRITKVENTADVFREKIAALEKREGVLQNDLSHIKQGLEEIKRLLREKNVASN